MPSTERSLSVGALTRRITDALADFGPVLVHGELSQARVAPSGHLYGTLKDLDATISVVMWRSSVTRHGPLPREGEAVEIRGHLSVYGPRGQYQLVATRISKRGEGDLAARFKALQERLTAEGLFAEEHKRELPFLPQAVGLATAAGSAAFADMVDSIHARFPQMPIIHAPCSVQGEQSVAQVVRAIEALDRHPEVDVIVVGRGGGSLEDLWTFNEEAVVRAIHACTTPIVSAVGHETDTTLADLAADLRAKTPTAAGEIVVPERALLDERVAALHAMLDEAIDEQIDERETRLHALVHHRALALPEHQLEMRQRRLDELEQLMHGELARRSRELNARWQAAAHALRLADPQRRLRELQRELAQQARALLQSGGHHLAKAERKLAANAAQLDALSPLAVIGRGYSVLRDADGKVVRHLDQAPIGMRISARLSDGWVDAEVTGQRPQKLAEPGDLYST